MSQYFPPCRSYRRDIKVELDLSRYATKTDLKNISHIDFSSFASKINLAILKNGVDKLEIAKLTPVPNDLAKLSNVVKNDVVKKTEYNNLVTKVDNIDTSGFVLKITYDTDKLDLEKKIRDAEKKIPNKSDLPKKTELNANINEIENKIPSITELATNSVLTGAENKIPNVINLVTKIKYNAKISDIEEKITNHNHDKYIATPEFNRVTTKF